MKKVLMLFCILIGFSCGTTRTTHTTFLKNFNTVSIDNLYLPRFDAATMFNVRGLPGPLIFYKN